MEKISTFQIALKTLMWVVLLGLALVVVAMTVNKDIRNKMLSPFSEQLSVWVMEHPDVLALKAEVDASRSATSRLMEENSSLKHKLVVLEGDITGLEDDLVKTRSEAEASKKQLNQEFDRLKSELDKEVSSREIAIDQVRENFTVIRVGDKVLFDSGKTVIKERGKEVLAVIAHSLKKFSGRQVRVIGHSDNVPIASDRIKELYPTNWELSSARAVSAVRYLIEQGGLDPAFVEAVGQGEHHPVATNETREGRARNRRIEIVLMPAQDSFKTESISTIK